MRKICHHYFVFIPVSQLLLRQVYVGTTKPSKTHQREALYALVTIEVIVDLRDVSSSNMKTLNLTVVTRTPVARLTWLVRILPTAQENN